LQKTQNCDVDLKSLIIVP